MQGRAGVGQKEGGMQGRADLTSCRCARPCRSGRRGGRAPSGGCRSPGSPRRPASSWLPASRRQTNPRSKPYEENAWQADQSRGWGFTEQQMIRDGEIGDPVSEQERGVPPPSSRRADEC